MLLVQVEATSHQIGILERKVNNHDIFKWMGASKFETIQLVKTVDAKLCNPLKVVMIEDYVMFDPRAEIVELEDDPIMPKGYDPLHIFIDEEYAFSTTRFENKKIALKYYREQEEYKEQNLTAKINNNSFKRRKIQTHLED